MLSLSVWGRGEAGLLSRCRCQLCLHHLLHAVGCEDESHDIKVVGFVCLVYCEGVCLLHVSLLRQCDRLAVAVVDREAEDMVVYELLIDAAVREALQADLELI